jgi:hypothetical protein
VSERFTGGHRFLVLLTCGIASLPLATFAEGLPVTDPTRPPQTLPAVKAMSALDSLLLYSTHVSATRKSAVINNQVVTTGSRIAGAVVTDIVQGRVSLRRGSEVIVLQLFPSPIKRPAKDPT